MGGVRGSGRGGDDDGSSVAFAVNRRRLRDKVWPWGNLRAHGFCEDATRDVGGAVPYTGALGLGAPRLRIPHSYFYAKESDRGQLLCRWLGLGRGLCSCNTLGLNFWWDNLVGSMEPRFWEFIGIRHDKKRPLKGVGPKSRMHKMISHEI